MDDLVRRFSELKAAEADVTSKRDQARGRLEVAQSKLQDHVDEVKALGFNSGAELQLAVEEARNEVVLLLEKADAKLTAGGYA